MSKGYNFLIMILILVIFVGCTTTKFVVDVSSLSVGNNDKKKIFIVPADKNVNINDVVFLEFAKYVGKALSKNGFIVVDNLDEADQVLFLGYAISEPQSYNVQVPMWGPTGIASSSTFGNINSSGNFYSNTNYNYQYGITGYMSRQVIYFTRVIVLTAYDWKLFVKTKKEKQIWQTNIISTGSSDDLRYVFPYMVLASEKYIGRSTRGKITVEVSEYDSRIKEYIQSD